MRIDTIKLINFKKFSDTELAFEPGVSLFVGENSSGKTSVLEAINVAIGGFFASREPKQNRYLLESEIRLVHGIKCEHSEVSATSSIIPAPWSRGKNSEGRNDSSKIGPIKKYGEQVYKNFENFEDRTVAPLIAYYSTQRLFIDARLSKEQKYDPSNGRRNGYLQCLEQNAIKPLLNMWLGNAVTRRATKNIQNIIDTDLVLENVEGAIKRTAIDFLGLPKGFPLKIYQDPERDNEVFLQFDSENPLPITYYADGFRNLLYLVIDMMWRASQLNPWLTIDEIGNQVTGVVTIDEIDLHLHPKWQAKAITLLQNLFPNVQFFITTHSPTVVANFEGGHLFLIDNSGEQINRIELSYFGKEINTILSEVLGAPDRNKETQDKIDRLFSQISNDQDESVINRSLEELTRLLGKTDKDILKAKSLIYWNKIKKEDPNAIHT